MKLRRIASIVLLVALGSLAITLFLNNLLGAARRRQQQRDEWYSSLPESIPVTSEDLKRLAEKGFVEAQYTLGFLYATGGGVPKDAQSNLAWIHFTGDGVQKDAAKGVQWLRKAADKGLAQ